MQALTLARMIVAASCAISAGPVLSGPSSQLWISPIQPLMIKTLYISYRAGSAPPLLRQK